MRRAFLNCEVGGDTFLRRFRLRVGLRGIQRTGRIQCVIVTREASGSFGLRAIMDEATGRRCVSVALQFWDSRIMMCATSFPGHVSSGRK